MRLRVVDIYPSPYGDWVDDEDFDPGPSFRLPIEFRVKAEGGEDWSSHIWQVTVVSPMYLHEKGLYPYVPRASILAETFDWSTIRDAFREVVEAIEVRILRVSVHSFSLNPYTRSRVFVHRRGD